jgi:NADH dehydrogenase FAD-containing subunit
MKITEVNQTEIKTQNSSTKRDDVVIWTCGVKPTDFTKGKPLLTDDYLMVDPDVYALGDIVANKGPPTAQNAKQQGIFLANHFNGGFKKSHPYKYVEKGRVLDTGDGLIVEYMGHVIILNPLFRLVFYYIAD